jgi:UDPglucose--hexose-1-phosphate uridylyltransferase
MAGDAWTFPHRRFNPLLNEWVLVSPQRNARPWQGQIEAPGPEQSAPYDPGCYLCPGNERAHGVRNPRYTSTFAFDNDFPALYRDSGIGSRDSESAPTSNPEPRIPNPDLLVAQAERGLCRVLCFTPRHDLTFARMDAGAIRGVVDAWVDEYAAAIALPWARYALMFENRGAMMGASNPHPHGQLWVTESVPNEPAREGACFDRHRAAHGVCLLCEYLQREATTGVRLVCQNDQFVALVPFWAIWPFETLVLSRRHVTNLDSLDDAERSGLAAMLKQLTTRYDNLFETPFPYSMGVHQQPMRDSSDHDWHLHLHFYPPLLRSAMIRKFMVGFELLGSPQRDLTPEEAAARLQAVGEVHYAARAGAGAR